MKTLMVLTPHEMLGKLSVELPRTFGKYWQNATMAGLHLTAFVTRRSGSAAAAWEVSPLLGLLVTVWAAMSALIISQVLRLHDTPSCSMGRICGSLLGIAISLSVSVIGCTIHVPSAMQMVLAVGICAIFTRLPMPTAKAADQSWTIGRTRLSGINLGEPPVCFSRLA
jgi:hypothetical protein